MEPVKASYLYIAYFLSFMAVRKADKRRVATLKQQQKRQLELFWVYNYEYTPTQAILILNSCTIDTVYENEIFRWYYISI